MRRTKPKNQSGVEFICFTGEASKSNKKILCRCPKCGNTFEMWQSHYYRGSNGCKCKVADKRLYRIYTNMKTRCYNQNSTEYKNYGGRGVSVCDEWLKNYHVFETWAFCNGYAEDLSIDRIDVNGKYEPSNCRWATNFEQAQNKRCTIKVHGTSLKNWCRISGINYKTLTGRIYRSSGVVYQSPHSTREKGGTY